MRKEMKVFYQADQYAPSGNQSGSGGEDFVFELIDGGKAYAVVGFSPVGVRADVVIPASYKGLPVTRIKYGAFKGCQQLVSVVIPNSVTDLCAWAFVDCKNLTYVYIPDSIKKLEEAVFMGCEKLTRIVLPDSLAMIMGYAFRGCENLTSILVPKALWVFGMRSFSGCNRLSEIYYKGTLDEWARISFTTENECLFKARVYCYSENRPTQQGNFWYYNANGEPTPW